MIKYEDHSEIFYKATNLGKKAGGSRLLEKRGSGPLFVDLLIY